MMVKMISEISVLVMMWLLSSWVLDSGVVCSCFYRLRWCISSRFRVMLMLVIRMNCMFMLVNEWV